MAHLLPGPFWHWHGARQRNARESRDRKQKMDSWLYAASSTLFIKKQKSTSKHRYTERDDASAQAATSFVGPHQIRITKIGKKDFQINNLAANIRRIKATRDEKSWLDGLAI